MLSGAKRQRAPHGKCLIRRRLLLQLWPHNAEVEGSSPSLTTTMLNFRQRTSLRFRHSSCSTVCGKRARAEAGREALKLHENKLVTGLTIQRVEYLATGGFRPKAEVGTLGLRSRDQPLAA